MASGVVDIPFRNDDIERCRRALHGRAPRSAVLQIGDTYRLARARGVVLWDVVWIGPLNRLFTRLRIESSGGSHRAFVLVHRDVDALRPAELAARASRFVQQEGYRLYGEAPLRNEACVELLTAMNEAHVAVLGAQSHSAWCLVYDVRFEPDQFGKCARVVESIALPRRGPYR